MNYSVVLIIGLSDHVLDTAPEEPDIERVIFDDRGLLVPGNSCIVAFQVLACDR